MINKLELHYSKTSPEGFYSLPEVALKINEIIDHLPQEKEPIYDICDNCIEKCKGCRVEATCGHFKPKEPLYPCKDCGKLRTKAEGGTIFTVCEECWDKSYKKQPTKEVCTCPKVKGVISSFCEKCGKPIEYKIEPTKEVPDIRGILDEFEKVLMNTYKSDGCCTSAITEIYKNKAIIQILTVVRKYLPEQKYYNNPANTLSQRAIGYNECLYEIKKIFGG